MAAPLKTIPIWVPNVVNPKILFITENYPKNSNAVIKNTYFYRTLHPQIQINGTNNLLNNICKTMNIVGATEFEKLDNFLYKNNYFLIDTYPCGQQMSAQLIKATINNISWIDNIIDDLLHINPQQIVFTCVGSNGMLLPNLISRSNARGLTLIKNTLIPNHHGNNKKVFHSPSNRAYPMFNTQIQSAIKSNLLKS
jgi:hypothetical protein